MTKYIVRVTADDQWLDKWRGLEIPEDMPTPAEQPQLWMEIATANTGISVESVHKSEEDDK